jgi:serine/threonine protein kinase
MLSFPRTLVALLSHVSLHQNIVRAVETFEYRNSLYVVLELCSGGDLYSRDPYSEEEAAHIVSPF